MDTITKGADGIHENHRHNELLAWATRRIDQLTSGECARQQVSEFLDWMAYFTREHFGFQERMLAECCRQRDYLARRAAIHLEFRRELAQLCIDSTRGDPTVAERLSGLCHRLLADAQAEQDAFSELVRTGGKPARLRADRRRHPLSDEARQILEARTTH
jgi:hemerythrin